MNKILFAAVAAGLASMLMLPPIASAMHDFLTVKAQVLVTDSIRAKILAHGIIPTDGTGGAFGYGILTDAGLDGVIVTTTHGGVLDSEKQSSAADTVFHNHYVKLGTGVSGLCGDDAEVVDITFQSPGAVAISGNKVKLGPEPFSFTGTSSLSGDPLTVTPGSDVQDVVSFKLDPKFDNEGNLAAVCVTDITSAVGLQIVNLAD
jgi:hypothetical protein